MFDSKENISADIVKRKTGNIVEKLAPELGIVSSQVSEIAAAIVAGVVNYKIIDKQAVIEVAQIVAPQIPALGEKIYDHLESCSERERLIRTGRAAIATVTVVLGRTAIGAAKVGIVQIGKTLRTKSICSTINNFSLGGIIKILSKK